MPTTHSHVNDEASHLVQQADVDKVSITDPLLLL